MHILRLTTGIISQHYRMNHREILALALTPTDRLQAPVILFLIITLEPTVISSLTDLRAILRITFNSITTYLDFFQLNTAQQEWYTDHSMHLPLT